MSINQSTFQYPVSFIISYLWYILIMIRKTLWRNSPLQCGWSFSTAPSSPVFFPAWQLEAKPPNRSTSASKFSLTERMQHKIYNPNSERVWITVCEQTTGNVMLYQQFFIYLVVNSRRYGSSTWQFLQEKYTTIPWGQSRGGGGGSNACHLASISM